ncbi:hypothetical protein [Streptomyces griseoaurantiacus]|uniref:hypothetical protein n=1 Tax=Streptomyces griseoaurantiacus TaxID=68213 RepID=UPI0037B8D639
MAVRIADRYRFGGGALTGSAALDVAEDVDADVPQVLERQFAERGTEAVVGGRRRWRWRR